MFRKTLFCAFLFLASNLLAAAVKVDLDSQLREVLPGQTFDIIVELEPGAGEQISSVNFDMVLPADFTFVSATAGATATAAVKDVTTNLKANNTVAFLIFGLNQNAIATGVVARASISVAQGAAPANYNIGPSNISLSSPTGTAIPSTISTAEVRVVAQAPSTAMAVVWDPVGLTGFRYRVYQATQPGGHQKGSFVHETDAAQYVLPSMVGRYYFVVTSLHVASGVESDFSNEVQYDASAPVPQNLRIQQVPVP